MCSRNQFAEEVKKIHTRRSVPEHPVIAAMERSGEISGHAWRRRVTAYGRKPQARQGQSEMNVPEMDGWNA